MVAGGAGPEGQLEGADGVKGGVDGGQCHILVVSGVGRVAPIKAVGVVPSYRSDKGIGGGDAIGIRDAVPAGHKGLGVSVAQRVEVLGVGQCAQCGAGVGNLQVEGVGAGAAGGVGIVIGVDACSGVGAVVPDVGYAAGGVVHHVVGAVVDGQVQGGHAVAAGGGGHVARVGAAAAVGGAAPEVAATCRHGIVAREGGGGEVGREGAVLRHRDGARVGGVAVIPVAELVACCGEGTYGGGGVVVARAAA